VAAEHDDPFGAESLRGDHTAEPDSAVTDDGGDLSGSDLRVKSGMVACAHHVRERQKRRHQGIALADRQPDERSVA
jgi:hypothetical protein